MHMRDTQWVELSAKPLFQWKFCCTQPPGNDTQIIVASMLMFTAPTSQFPAFCLCTQTNFCCSVAWVQNVILISFLSAHAAWVWISTVFLSFLMLDVTASPALSHMCDEPFRATITVVTNVTFPASSNFDDLDHIFYREVLRFTDEEIDLERELLSCNTVLQKYLWAWLHRCRAWWTGTKNFGKCNISTTIIPH